MVRNTLCLSVCLSQHPLAPWTQPHVLASGPTHMLSSARCAPQLTPPSHKGCHFLLTASAGPTSACLPARAPATDMSILELMGVLSVAPPGGHAWIVGCCGQAPGSPSFPLLFPRPQHVFCEECLCLWLDRERTCPLCRSVAVDTLRCWKDGATSAHLQVY